jgi:hypothetical protein
MLGSLNYFEESKLRGFGNNERYKKHMLEIASISLAINVILT